MWFMNFDNSYHRALPLLLLLTCAEPGGISAEQSTRDLMANAMARMMDAMGLFDSASSQQGGGTGPDPFPMMDPLGAAPWGPGFGIPRGSPFQDRSRAFAMGEMMKQLSEAMPGLNSAPGPGGGWPASRLEGVWEGRNGELLIVQGGRFRIYSPGMQRVDGLIQVRRDRLALYNPQDEQAQPFKFAESRGRLILRGLDGQTYLYRRLWLDGRQPGGTSKAPSMR